VLLPGGGAMTEMQLVLSLEALRAMAHGTELVFDVDDGEGPIRVMLRCDDHALATIRDQVEKAMLHFLPVEPGVH